jgi:hypothetical protein
MVTSLPDTSADLYTNNNKSWCSGSTNTNNFSSIAIYVLYSEIESLVTQFLLCGKTKELAARETSGK